MADIEVQFPCPFCGREIKTKLRQLSSGHSARCPNCGTLIQFDGDGGRRAQGAIDDLNRQIRRLNRQLRLKLKI